MTKRKNVKVRTSGSLAGPESDLANVRSFVDEQDRILALEQKPRVSESEIWERRNQPAPKPAKPDSFPKLAPGQQNEPGKE